MAIKIISNTAWVDADGSYGEGDLVTFDSSDLSDRQWDVFTNLRDNDRIDYVVAIMNGDPTSEWED